MAANAPGVVTVKFIDNVDEFVGARDVDAALTELQEKYSALKGLEGRLQQRRVKLMQKLPDIKKALDMVQLLIAKRGTGEALKVDYELTDSVFAKALLVDTEEVSLWLGANVMLQYSLDEAQTLLSENHSSCAEQLEQLKAELATVRDSVTILEVSIARVFNWDVSRKRAAGAGKLAEGGAAAAVEPAGAE